MANEFLARVLSEGTRQQAERAMISATARVRVANKDRSYGERLRREDVVAVVWQTDSLPEGAFVVEVEPNEDPAEPPVTVLTHTVGLGEEQTREEVPTFFPEGLPDRFVLRNIEAFEPILLSKVTEPGEDAGITSRLTRGLRAFAIRVDVTSGVSGFLRPGDRVDVYWTGQGATSGVLGQDVTKLIQPNIRLIAVDQIADTDRTAPVIARTVTVEATPQEVARLAQAQTTGRLSLSLVGAEDDTIAQVDQVDQNALLGIQAVAPEIVIEERVCTTRVRRGAEIIEQEIPCTN